jgi:hypothetical protein
VRLALLAIALCSCGEAVSPPELGDYTTWYRVDTYGNVPGHGDSYRMIYVNDIARHMGTTAKDAVLVKEVHDNDNGMPGDLRTIEIMRKTHAGTARDDNGGWLFTAMPEPGGDETEHDFCWGRCHVAAPYAGAWFDYTQ